MQIQVKKLILTVIFSFLSAKYLIQGHYVQESCSSGNAEIYVNSINFHISRVYFLKNIHNGKKFFKQMQ